MNVSLRQIAEAIEAFAAPGLAEPWDRSGLQVGDPEQTVHSVLVALDPSPAAVAEAERRGAELLLTHHPLLLKPLDRVDLSSPRGAVVARLLRAGIGLYAAHTNLDRAEGGVNDALARSLGLDQVGPLGAGELLVKLVLTVPVGYEPQVRQALFRAGAGRIGNYRDCSFGVRGEGTFQPHQGATPFLGEVGRPERVDETRLEVVAARAQLAAVVAAARQAHPYETPAIDTFPLEDRADSGTPGRIGVLAREWPLGKWASAVGRCLQAPGVRWVGDPETRVRRVAVCGGSGAELWGAAQQRGADVLVTGDVKYHAALDMAAAGFAVVDVGHGPSESVALQVLASRVASWAEGRGGPEVTVFREPDPFRWVVEQ